MTPVRELLGRALEDAIVPGPATAERARAAGPPPGPPPRRGRWAAGTIAATVLSAAAVLLAPPLAPAGAVLLVAVLPGLAVLLAVRGTDRLRRHELVVLAPVLSLGLTALTVLLADATGLPLTRAVICGALTELTVLAAVAALADLAVGRPGRRPAGDPPAAPPPGGLDLGLDGAGPRTARTGNARHGAVRVPRRARELLAAAAVAALLAAAAGVTAWSVGAAPETGFTLLAAHRGDGTPDLAVVEVRNAEGSRQRYRVLLRDRSDPALVRELDVWLDDGATGRWPVRVPAGGLGVELRRAGEAAPYRLAWISPLPGPAAG